MSKNDGTIVKTVLALCPEAWPHSSIVLNAINRHSNICTRAYQGLKWPLEIRTEYCVVIHRTEYCVVIHIYYWQYCNLKKLTLYYKTNDILSHRWRELRLTTVYGNWWGVVPASVRRGVQELKVSTLSRLCILLSVHSPYPFFYVYNHFILSAIFIITLAIYGV